MAHITPEVKAIVPELIALRRVLHQYPELGFKETRTAGLIEKHLKKSGVETKRMVKTGTVGLIRGRRPGKTVLFRADMDGLPVMEENKVPYRSRNNGVMHACGHDGHVAISLMAARILARRRDRLAGNVKFMFQPAEEGPGGAMPMIQAGLLERPHVDAAFALHMWNDLPVGTLGVRSGPVFANVDEFTARIIGRGGHGAAPNQTIDPIVTAAYVITALQNIVSRKVDPLESAVVTIGRIEGGSKHNIIPDLVTLYGTVRSFDRRVRGQLQREIERVIRGVTGSMGARYELNYRHQYPATVNDDAMTQVVVEAAQEVVGKRGVIRQDPTMGAEDMSLVLQKVPGSYFMLGSANPKKGLANPHHSARFDFDEASLPIGVEAVVRVVERFLNSAR